MTNQHPSARQQELKKLPLIVDLDGTLLATDTLYESIAQNFFTRPLKTIFACLGYLKGRAQLKENIAALDAPDVDAMPKHSALIDYIKAARADGRPVHLVTAAHQKIADQVHVETALFDSATGSTIAVNLKSAHKANYLKKQFPDGFVYAGDSRADLAVWDAAAGAITVGVTNSVASAVKAQGTSVEQAFGTPNQTSALRNWRKALRLHQWSKNILLFVPLVLAHVYDSPDLVIKTALGFLLMGFVASGTYLINDLSDLSADRRHATKQDRPLASGAISVQLGFIAAALLIAGGTALAFLLEPRFGAGILVYLIITLSYSLSLKRVALLDVFILSLLYSVRVLLGVALVAVTLSAWLVAFSFFFFYSMSLAKRHVELVRSKVAPDETIPGRGYRPSDWPLTLNLGASSAVGAIIVIVLYLTEEAFPSGSYSAAGFLWAAPVLIALWMQRIWLLSHRGDLDDDPVAFAVKDPISIGLGIALGIFFCAATFL